MEEDDEFENALVQSGYALPWRAAEADDVRPAFVYPTLGEIEQYFIGRIRDARRGKLRPYGVYYYGRRGKLQRVEFVWARCGDDARTFAALQHVESRLSEIIADAMAELGISERYPRPLTVGDVAWFVDVDFGPEPVEDGSRHVIVSPLRIDDTFDPYPSAC